jgi:hypothetical protein
MGERRISSGGLVSATVFNRRQTVERGSAFLANRRVSILLSIIRGLRDSCFQNFRYIPNDVQFYSLGAGISDAVIVLLQRSAQLHSTVYAVIPSTGSPDSERISRSGWGILQQHPDILAIQPRQCP